MDVDLISCGMNKPDLHSNIQIALANMPVSDKNIEASYLQKPVVNRARYAQLSRLLNSISTYRTDAGRKINLVIFPEVSIPFAWEPLLTNWARKSGIGLLCGLEHHVRQGTEENTDKYDDTGNTTGHGKPCNIAYNEVLTALPFRDDKGHNLCIPIKRLKRLYSPGEKRILNGYGIEIPAQRQDRQQLIRWKGVSFAIYNCYELCSLEERSLFKGKVDFIICTEYNKDVNYFSNIVESAARDLHCYMVQVNDCRYGDSRVIRPSQTKIMNPLRIKGGNNLTFLTLNLDLEALRDHQLKGYELHKDSEDFKPLPPDYDRKDVQERINLGQKV